MLIKRDLNTHSFIKPLDYGDAETPNVVGSAVIQYEVQRYVDTRNLSERPSYLVSCSQRIVLSSDYPYSLKPGIISGYDNYPGAFGTKIQLDRSTDIDTVNLVDYFPRTLNASVETNHTAGQSSSDGSSRQHTTGSSQSQTNTFGVSESLGFMGPAPMGNVSIEASTSNTRETSRSNSDTRSLEHGAQVSNSSSMSIKDWGSYAEVDKLNATPGWVWGQEYPWNIIQFNDLNADNTINLPLYVKDMLADGKQLLPPSELSLFGVDVVTTATWLVSSVPGTPGDQAVTFTHSFEYTVASHKLQDPPAGTTGDPALVAKLNYYGELDFGSDALDLPLLGLDPLSDATAVVGFLPRHFDVDPSEGGTFAISSDTNDLVVRGTGFASTQPMTTDFSKGAATFRTYFKVTDPTSNVSLGMKHWVTGFEACAMKVKVNGVDLPSRVVTLPKDGTGEDNVMTVTLRHKDYTSNDYCDYLQYGLNTVELEISPTVAGQAGTYTILAMAVE